MDEVALLDREALDRLAADPRHQDDLRTWRDRMIKHLSERGDEFVRDGKLVFPRKNMLLSSNYPPDPPDESSPSARAARRAQTRPTRDTRR